MIHWHHHCCCNKRAPECSFLSKLTVNVGHSLGNDNLLLSRWHHCLGRVPLYTIFLCLFQFLHKIFTDCFCYSHLIDDTNMAVNCLDKKSQVRWVVSWPVKVLELLRPVLTQCCRQMGSKIVFESYSIKGLISKPFIIDWFHDLLETVDIGLGINPGILSKWDHHARVPLLSFICIRPIFTNFNCSMKDNVRLWQVMQSGRTSMGRMRLRVQNRLLLLSTEFRMTGLPVSSTVLAYDAHRAIGTWLWLNVAYGDVMPKTGSGGVPVKDTVAGKHVFPNKLSNGVNNCCLVSENRLRRRKVPDWKLELVKEASSPSIT